MFNEVIVQQIERQEPQSQEEAQTILKRASSLLFDQMNRKYIRPLEADTKPLVTQKDQDKVLYYEDNKPLFYFEQDRFITSKTDPRITFRMVSLAGEQNATSITVKGKRQFRKQAWLYGQLQGMTVKGYTPTRFDLRLLKEARSIENSVAIPTMSNLAQSSTVQHDGIPKHEKVTATPHDSKHKEESSPSETGSKTDVKEHGKSPSHVSESKSATQGGENQKPTPSYSEGIPTTTTPTAQMGQLWEIIGELRFRDEGRFYQQLFDNRSRLPSESALQSLRDHLPDGESRDLAELALSALNMPSRSSYIEATLEYLPFPVKHPDQYLQPYLDHRVELRKLNEAHQTGKFQDAQQAQRNINRLEANVLQATGKIIHFDEERLNEPMPLRLSLADQRVVDSFLYPQRWAEESQKMAKRETEFPHHSTVMHIENSKPNSISTDYSLLLKRHQELEQKISQCQLERHRRQERWYRHELALNELEALWLATGEPVDLKRTYPVAGEPLVLTPDQEQSLNRVLSNRESMASKTSQQTFNTPSKVDDEDELLARFVLPDCLDRIERNSEECLSKIREATTLYGTDIAAHREALEASLQTTVQDPSLVQEDLAIVLGYLEKNFDTTASLLFKGIDEEKLRETLKEHLEQRIREIDTKKALPDASNVQLLEEHQKLQQDLARLKSPPLKTRATTQQSIHA